MASILVVDDELGIRGLLSEILGDEGHTVELAENAAQARAARERAAPDLVLLDIWMPDVDGITLLKEWSAAGLLTMPVIMMSGHGTIDTAVEATKHGAMAFLEKPITLQKLLRSVELGLQRNTPRPAPAVAAPMGWPRPEEPVAYTSVPVNGVVTHSLSPTPSGPSPDQVFHLDRPLREARDAFERSYFEFHLAKEGGSMTRVAEKTGLERTHLYRKLKQLGVDISRAKRGG
jgi:DNA-binding NtrC family response regulator